jgi:hypothetical protein
MARHGLAEERQNLHGVDTGAEHLYSGKPDYSFYSEAILHSSRSEYTSLHTYQSPFYHLDEKAQSQRFFSRAQAGRLGKDRREGRKRKVQREAAEEAL